MGMLDTIRARRDEVYAIAKRHKAERLWVFGSCARGDETPESDIDFFVKFRPDASWREDDALAEKCRALFGRNVDVVRNTTLRKNPRFAWRVCPEAVVL